MRLRRAAPAALVLAAIALTGCVTAGASGSTSPEGSRTPSASSAPSTSSAPSAAATPDTTVVPIVAANPVPVLPATVTDVNGDEVTVTDVSRIVSLSGGVSELLVALGLGENIVGRDVTTETPGLEDVTLVSNGHDTSAESVLSLDPTIVVADEDSGPPEALDVLRAAGITVLVVPSVWTFDDAVPRARTIANAMGLPQYADALVDTISAPTVKVDEPVRIAFLYVRGTAAVYMIAGDGSGADSVVEAIGGIDAGTEAGLTGYTPLTPEALVTAAPDVILVMDKGLESVGGIDGLLALPGVAQTPAGKERRIVSVPDGDLLSFGPRSSAVLTKIAEQVNDVL